MESVDRRAAILAFLEKAEGPVSATALAGRFSVSRQVVVGDVALLRAAGADIAATPRGYLIPRTGTGEVHTVVCRHTAGDLKRELDLVVDQGCTVVDVVVEHPVYGELTGGLLLSSRYDVEQFIQKVEDSDAAPLSLLTGGIHLHTLRCPSEEVFDRVQKALDQAGFLVREASI